MKTTSTSTSLSILGYLKLFTKAIKRLVNSGADRDFRRLKDFIAS